MEDERLQAGGASRVQMAYDEEPETREAKEVPPPDMARPGVVPRPGKGYSQREADARQYRRARKGLVKAIEMLDTYEEMGIRPCDIAVLHLNIRAAFGYN